MKHMNDEQLQLVSGGEISTQTAVTLVVVTAVSPLLGLAMYAGYMANSDLEDCG
ncbi:hypothetical protein [Silanimonas sp.]|uniref:hypothetical protein n=1 Tax=Silanimonas sp. TaxID=1929290 RepID=UPI0022C414DB|nr:hypothetical protein [Silanimonas sp.]MCZ8114988.1 hypothetical protein [Silanimonas sp.]